MMKRKVTKLMAALMLLTCITLPAMGWGQVPSVAPANGNDYVVAAYVNNKYYALPCTTTNGSTIEGVEITLNSLNKVNTSDAAGKTWTLEEGTGTNAGKYYFKYTSGSSTYYLYKNGTGNSNYNFKVSTTSKNYWSFTTNGTGYTVAAVDRGTNHVNIQCNNGTFRCNNSATAIILLEVGDVPSSGYIVTYNGNGATSGTVPTDNTEYGNGATVTVLGNTGNLAQTGYTFGGWNTQSDGQGTNYTAGQTFQISDHTTLYAKWTVNTHNVTMPSANQYGSYTASATTNVAYGTTVTLTYTPATGFESYAATWSVNGEEIEGNTFTMPDQDVTVTVSVAEATEATFIFNTDDGLTALGITIPSSGGTDLDVNHDYVSGIVTMNITHGTTHTRVWTGTSATDLRVYGGGGSLTFSVPSGQQITSIILVGEAPSNFNEISSKAEYTATWSGTPNRTVTLTANGTCKINTITVVYEANASGVDTPELPAAGSFENEKQITITCVTENATVYYTTDGSNPQTSNTREEYTAPFTINATTTVKAVACLNSNYSNVAEATYTRVYNITVVQPVGGAISASLAQAAAGAEITLTATANIGYAFGSWSVTPSVTVASNQFVMPASDVTVTAAFTTTTAYTVSFSVNNKIEMTATVNSGNSIDLTKFVAEGNGYTFEGWSTTAGEEIINPQNAYTPSGNITLYPGVAPAPSGDEYTLVTNVNQLEAGNLVVITAQNTSGYALSTQSTNNRTAVDGVTKSANPYTNITINSNDVCELTLGKVVDGNNTYWTFYDPDYDDGTNTGGYLYTASTSSNWLKTQHTNDANGEWTISFTTGGYATITSHGESTHNYLKYNTSKLFSSYLSTSGNTQPVFIYTKPASKSAKVNRDGVPTTSKVTGIAANVLVTVKSNGIVYLTGSNAGNAANLVVEDGGQLVTSANVQGTMLKSITGYTGTKDNYYLISSPLSGNNTDPLNVRNMVNTNSGEDYDLYRFVQNATEVVDGETVGREWRNYKDSAFTLWSGSGYLYANSEDVDLEFAGQLLKNDNATTAQHSISLVSGYSFSGWNLVGNPFAGNAQVNMAFYKMNNTGDGINATAMTANSVIATMEGVFVIATGAENEKVTFTATTAAVSTGAKNGISIDVTSNNEFLDRAIMDFSNESLLNKLNLSESTTKVYFQQDQKEYAIVPAGNENERPFCFKAGHNGRYTISVNAEDLDITYLHLIDNKAGQDVDLLVNPSYTFEATTGDYANRFKLVFNATGVDENGASTGSATFAFFNGSEWVINNEGNATLQVVDMMGLVVSSEAINGNANLNLNQAAGVYMLRLVNGENVMVQKIVVR